MYYAKHSIYIIYKISAVFSVSNTLYIIKCTFSRPILKITAEKIVKLLLIFERFQLFVTKFVVILNIGSVCLVGDANVVEA